MSGGPAHGSAGRRSAPSALDPWIFERLGALARLREQLAAGAGAPGQDRLLEAVRAVLVEILPFEASGFLLVADDLDFELASCAPAQASEELLSEVARSIETGSFGWALGRNRAVLLPAAGGPRTLLLHALATPGSTLGMFAGLLEGEGPTLARAERDLLSIALHQCAAALETALLQRDREGQARRLEAQEARQEPALPRQRPPGSDPTRGPRELLAALCGELRWPLAGLRALAERLLATPALEAEEARGLAQRIRGGAQALETLAADAREWAAAPAAWTAPRAEPFDPRALARELGDLLRAGCAARGLEAAVEIAPDLPAQLLGDDRCLRQVLLLLLGSALASTRSGSVELRAELEERGPETARLRLSVTDAGPGLSEAALERLRAPDPGEPGSAPEGLALARLLLEEMGGELRLESRLGLGVRSSMSLTLPAPADPGHPGRARDRARGEQAAPRGPGGPRVLVLEDNAVNQKVMGRILEKLGCRVALVADGVAALDCLERESYELVFLDCRLSEMDGFETTTAIRRRERAGAHTPIVAVTADASGRDRERCLASGMDDHVSKPVRSADLRRILERWVPS